MRMSLNMLWWEARMFRNSRLGRQTILRRNQRRFASLAAFLHRHSPYYATTEMLVIGMAEPKSQGMVLLEDDLWIEVEEDRLLVTNLRNRTTPLIRYVHADAVTLSGSRERYDYYRGFRRIDAIAGRREERFVLANEKGEQDFIHPLLIVEFYVRGVERYQVVHTGPAAFVFRAKAEAGLSPAERERAEREIRAKWNAILAQKNMRNVRYQVQWTDALYHDPHSGKFRLVLTSMPESATVGNGGDWLAASGMVGESLELPSAAW